MTPTRRQRAKQAPEYLAPAAEVIDAALERWNYPNSADVLDALAEAGWHLLTYEDAEQMLNAYVMQAIR